MLGFRRRPNGARCLGRLLRKPYAPQGCLPVLGKSNPASASMVATKGLFETLVIALDLNVPLVLHFATKLGPRIDVIGAVEAHVPGN